MNLSVNIDLYHKLKYFLEKVVYWVFDFYD